jgi:hypothetical protein
MRALDFMTKMVLPPLKEHLRTGGETLRYDPLTNEFGVSSPDGFLVTYFKPDPAEHGLASNILYFIQECAKP